MKILFYNWAPFDDARKRGGGVTVYLFNLLRQLSTNSEIECFFLSSGTEYTFDGKLRIEETGNQLEGKIRSFQIVNSPIHAPASLQFAKLNDYLRDISLYNLLDGFLTQQGEFDIIHFHNLEGLSVSVLKLKEKYSATKFVFSLHNYFLFCPQVNLWSPNGNCYLSPQFPDCSKCVASHAPQIESMIAALRKVLKVDRGGKQPKSMRALKKWANMLRSLSVDINKRQCNRCEARKETVTASYSKYREENIAAVNQYMDLVLAVSEKVAKIAEEYGIAPSKIVVNYIGSQAASAALPIRKKIGDSLRIGYMGYARTDKGFDALLQALEEVPTKIASKITLILAAKCENERIFNYYSQKVETLKNRFDGVSFFNGYTKEEQEQLMKQIDLGIVPPLWEDNLPQVAIEFVAHGIPILASDAGGANELCTNRQFVFKSVEAKDLRDKIMYFAESPERVNSFWEMPCKLKKMDEHITELVDLYRGLLRS